MDRQYSRHPRLGAMREWRWARLLVVPAMVLALLGSSAASFAAAQDVTADTTVTASLYEGICADLADSPVAVIAEITVPANTDAATALQLAIGSGILPVSLANLLSADFSIVIEETDSDDGETERVACGEVGGTIREDGTLAIGLREDNETDLLGFVFLSPSLDGSQVAASIFLGEELIDEEDEADDAVEDEDIDEADDEGEDEDLEETDDGGAPEADDEDELDEEEEADEEDEDDEGFDTLPVIIAGNCEDLTGTPVADLNPLTEAEGDDTGAEEAAEVAVSVSLVELPLTELQTGDFSLVVTEDGEPVACGPITGELLPDGGLAVGLAEVDDSGVVGAVYLFPDATGTGTQVTVFVSEDVAAADAGEVEVEDVEDEAEEEADDDEDAPGTGDTSLETDTDDAEEIETEAPEVDEPEAPEVDEPEAPEIDEPGAPDVDEPEAPEIEEPEAPDVDEPDEPEVDDVDEPEAPEVGEPDEDDEDDEED